MAFFYWSIHYLFFLFLFDSFGDFNSLESLCFADCHWYERIVINGYYHTANESNLVFFPLFPFLAKLITFAGYSAKEALVIVNILFSLLFWVALCALIKNLKYKNVLCILIMIYPSSYIIYLGYSEALFVTFLLFIIKQIKYLNIQSQNIYFLYFKVLFALIFLVLTRVNGIFVLLALAIYIPFFKKVFSKTKLVSLFLLPTLVLSFFYLRNSFIANDLDFFRNIQTKYWNHAIPSIFQMLQVDVLCSFYFDQLISVVVLITFVFLFVVGLKKMTSLDKSFFRLHFFILLISAINVLFVFYSKSGEAKLSGAARYLLPGFLIMIFQLFNIINSLNKNEFFFAWAIVAICTIIFSSTVLSYIYKLSQQVYFEDPWLFFENLSDSARNSFLRLFFSLLCG